jgi:EAL domain-containing protein (putative c-di-GMP-specific phosphodiesterase class I)
MQSASNLSAAILHDGATTSGSIERILRAVRDHLGMDVAFVSEFSAGRRFFRHVDAGAVAPLQVGDSSPLDEGYCQRVVDGRLPELIPDTADVPEAMALPVTTVLPVGAHLSVPIRLRDGRVYGTFCCFSFTPDRTLNERDLGVMRAFADLSTTEIQRDLDAHRDRDEKVARINAALRAQQMSIAYQPIYTLDENSRVAGLECLARFSGQPYRSPDQWFAEAGLVGLGTELEVAAVRMALATLPLLPDTVYLGVNASPDAILTGAVGAALDDTSGERIVLEITEHASIADYGALSAALAPMRAKGVRLAIDDAGAGFASFRHILNLQPDMIKLDITLTRNIDSDPARRALASALITFARDTGSRIVAEGVETASELEALRSLGVHKAQGYFLGRPMPLEGVSELLGREAA